MSSVRTEQFILKPPADLQFIDDELGGEQTGFRPIPTSERRGEFVRDMLRGVFGKDSSEFSETEARLQQLERQRIDADQLSKQAIEKQQCELIKTYFSKRWGVNLSSEALNSCGQKFWTSPVKAVSTICANNKGYFLEPTEYSAAFGTAGGSVYVVCTLSKFVQKPMDGMGAHKISGSLQLVYEVVNNAFVPLGYTSTDKVADELAALKKADHKKTASKEEVLNLSILSPPPQAYPKSLFATAGVFCSILANKLAAFFLSRRNKTKATAQPNISAVKSSLKSATPREHKGDAYRTMLPTNKGTPQVIKSTHKEEQVKAVQKRSFVESIFGCFRKAPAQPSRQPIVLDTPDEKAIPTSRSFHVSN